MMDDAIQRLLDEARPVVARWKREADSWSWTMGWIVEMVDALEAAGNPKCEHGIALSDLCEAASSHANDERPLVSPEVRGEVARLIDPEPWKLSDEEWDEEYGFNGVGRGRDKRSRRMMEALGIADTILARFALPELDPEKVAELLATHDWDAEREACTCRERGWSFEHVADMLIDALPTLTKGVE